MSVWKVRRVATLLGLNRVNKDRSDVGLGLTSYGRRGVCQVRSRPGDSDMRVQSSVNLSSNGPVLLGATDVRLDRIGPQIAEHASCHPHPACHLLIPLCCGSPTLSVRHSRMRRPRPIPGLRDVISSMKPDWGWRGGRGLCMMTERGSTIITLAPWAI